MDYNKDVSVILEELLNEMPNNYTKLKGTWLWEMFKAFSIKLHNSLELLTEVSNKFDIANLQGDELDAYVQQWSDIKRKTAKNANGYIKVIGNGTIYKGTIVSNGIINYETPDEECDLDYVPNVGRKQDLEYVLTNSLGFGGHNAVLLLKKWK